MSSFSSSGPARPSGPSSQDLQPQGMRDLLGKGVTSMRQTERPIDGFSSSSSAASSGLGNWRPSHSGTEVRTADGGHWLVHKGDNFGRETGGNTVVTDARHMSGNWKPTSEWTSVTPGARVTDFVREGGKNYGLMSDNCHMATGAMSKKFGNSGK